MEELFSRWSELHPDKPIPAALRSAGAVLAVDQGLDEDPALVSAALKLLRRHMLGIVSDALGESPGRAVARVDEASLTPGLVAIEVVRHSVSLIDVFVSQFPGVPHERLVLAFLETVRGCLGTGYKRSWQALDNLGLVANPSVRAAVEQTRDLIRRMLTLYEHHKREELSKASPQLARKNKSRKASGRL